MFPNRTWPATSAALRLFSCSCSGLFKLEKLTSAVRDAHGSPHNGGELKALPKPLGTIMPRCSRGFRVTFNWAPMVQRYASFSDSCTYSKDIVFSSLGVNRHAIQQGETCRVMPSSPPSFSPNSSPSNTTIFPCRDRNQRIISISLRELSFCNVIDQLFQMNQWFFTHYHWFT